MRIVRPDRGEVLQTGPEHAQASLYDLIQWCCQSFGLQPTPQYFLRHERKLLLDWSLMPVGRLAGSLEFVGVDELGHKELAEIQKAREAPVGLAIGTQRLRFPGTTRLVDALRTFIRCDDLCPSVQYGNRLIAGEDLGKSLWHLGLSGSCLLKLDHSHAAPYEAGPLTTSLLSPNPTNRVEPITQQQSSPTYVEPDYDMDMVIIEPTAQVSPVSSNDLPDEYYTLTSAELLHFHSSAVRQSKALQDAPLLSKAAQGRVNTLKILQQHPFTRIRFRFPDGLLIERNFRTEEGVQEMLLWLGNLLHNNCFVLSVGPPVKLLRAGESIIQLQLYPASIVNVLWTDPAAMKGISSLSLLSGHGEELKPSSKRPNSPPPVPTVRVPDSVPKTGGQAPKWLKLHK